MMVLTIYYTHWLSYAKTFKTWYSDGATSFTQLGTIYHHLFQLVPSIIIGHFAAIIL